MATYRVTLKAYGMTQTRYIEAESAADARRDADGRTSIGRVIKVVLVEPVNGASTC